MISPSPPFCFGGPVSRSLTNCSQCFAWLAQKRGTFGTHFLPSPSPPPERALSSPAPFLPPSPRFALEAEGEGPSSPACQRCIMPKPRCSMAKQRLGLGRMHTGNQLWVEGHAWRRDSNNLSPATRHQIPPAFPFYTFPG